jgi:hypothetical protein
MSRSLREAPQQLLILRENFLGCPLELFVLGNSKFGCCEPAVSDEPPLLLLRPRKRDHFRLFLRRKFLDQLDDLRGAHIGTLVARSGRASSPLPDTQPERRWAYFFAGVVSVLKMPSSWFTSRLGVSWPIGLPRIVV